MADKMTPAHEAAAFWGSAKSRAYTLEQRLACALKALEFYGGYYERTQKVAERMVEWTNKIQGQEIAGHWVDEASGFAASSGIVDPGMLTPKRLDDPIELGQVVMYMGVMDHYRGYHFYVSRFRDLPSGERRYDLSRTVNDTPQTIIEDVPRQAIQPLPAEEKD